MKQNTEEERKDLNSKFTPQADICVQSSSQQESWKKTKRTTS